MAATGLRGNFLASGGVQSEAEIVDAGPAAHSKPPAEELLPDLLVRPARGPVAVEAGPGAGSATGPSTSR